MTTDDIVPIVVPDEPQHNSQTPSDDTVPKLTEKELVRLEKQRLKEAERAEKERRKEEERQRKEDEKLRKQKEKELEREAKKQKLEEEKAEKEKKREEERLEREAKKEEERLEREAKKEEERLKKQQAMEAREQARLQKKRKLEEEKEERETRRRKMEEEKKKKEESQMKISSFFTKKHSVSVELILPEKDKESDLNDYEREFLPFFVTNHMILADMGQLSEQELIKSKNEFDQLLKSPSTSIKFDFKKQSDNKITKSVITPDDIIELLNSPTATESEVHNIIQKLPPIKYISFYENSKPPYIGTWCSLSHQKNTISPLDPLNTNITGLDYDYDSDLEWTKNDDEVDDGEDIDIEDDEEEEIVADEDDLGWVEDDQVNNPAKRFQSMNVVIKINDGSSDFFDTLVTKVLVDLPIDPFKVDAPPVVVDDSPKKQKKVKSEDPKVIGDILNFYNSENLGSFSITTILELVMKKLNYTDKALIRGTLHHLLKKDKQTSTWVVKKEFKDIKS